MTLSPTLADIIATGDVSPSTDPSTWISSTSVAIGSYGAGSLSITNGSSVNDFYADVGENGGAPAGTSATGTVTVDGAGSAWTNSGNLYVGNANGANGTLNITNGGSVVTSSYTFVGNYGAGTINVNGVGSTFTSGGTDLYVTNGGTLNITNGGSVLSYWTFLSGGGSATVSGAGSTWTVDPVLEVGETGNGSLSITNGGRVSVGGTTGAILGWYNTAAHGFVTVDGAGSNLSISYALDVGSGGTSTLSISDKGFVSASTVSIGSGSTVTVDVGSSLAGAITNNGTIRLVAGAGAAPGTYSPIAGTWSRPGTIQALGGVWNATNNTVTVSAAATTTTGTAANFDLSQTQRVLVTDIPSGKSVGAGFQAASTSTPITFGASLVGGSELSSFQGLLGSGQSVLSAWTFSTNASVSSTNPVYLSLFAGSGQSITNDLEIWEFSGLAWTQFAANDLAYDGTYASFTTTDLEDFAVTGEEASTPIPSALLLLGPGLVVLAFMRKRVFSV